MCRWMGVIKKKKRPQRLCSSLMFTDFPCFSIVAFQGFSGFYRGYFSTVMREIPFSVIQFSLWEYFKVWKADLFQDFALVWEKPVLVLSRDILFATAGFLFLSFQRRWALWQNRDTDVWQSSVCGAASGMNLASVFPGAANSKWSDWF